MRTLRLSIAEQLPQNKFTQSPVSLMSFVTIFGASRCISYLQGQYLSKCWSQGKGVHLFVVKYGANVDGYSPIYSPEEWSPSGDVYVGGTIGLPIWALTLAGRLAGGAPLVFKTSALAQ